MRTNADIMFAIEIFGRGFLLIARDRSDDLFARQHQMDINVLAVNLINRLNDPYSTFITGYPRT